MLICRQLTLHPPDLLVLANVASFTQVQADDLARLVQAGMGLMVFVGDQVDPANYNQLLYKGGQGLLPAPLDLVIDEELSGLIVEADLAGAARHTAAAQPCGAGTRPHQEVVSARRTRRGDQPGPGSLEQCGQQRRPPWRGSSAQGASLLWTIAADRQWSDWPTEPSYVLAMREAAVGIAAHRRWTSAGYRRRGRCGTSYLRVNRRSIPRLKSPAVRSRKRSRSKSSAPALPDWPKMIGKC